MTEDRETQIRELFPLVRTIAKRLARTIRGADFDDLIGDGSLGLIRAVDGFDSERGVPLEHYARRVILGAMLNGLRRLDPVSERVRRALRTAEDARYAWAQERGSMPAMSEMECVRPGLAQARAAAYIAAPLSLDAPLPADETGLLDDDSDPAQIALVRSIRAEIREAIALLPARQRRVVMLHYYDNLSLHAIGPKLSVSAQRASQLHLAALKRLRERLPAG